MRPLNHKRIGIFFRPSLNARETHHSSRSSHLQQKRYGLRTIHDSLLEWEDEESLPVKLHSKVITSNEKLNIHHKQQPIILQREHHLPLTHSTTPNILRTYETETQRQKTPLRIIMLHGLFGSHENFALLSKLLLSDLQLDQPIEIHSLDLRNHGDSPDTMNHSYSLMAKDVQYYMDTMHIDQAVLIGHSMGGKTAMYYALAVQPSRVKAMISIDIAPVSYLGVTSHNFRFDLLRRALPSIESITSKKQVEDILSKYLPDRAERGYLLKNLIEIRGDADGIKPQFKWKINLDTLFQCQYKILDFPLITSASFQKPALFIGGSKSHRLGQEYVSSIRNLFPKAQLKMVEGGGHFIHAQKPSTVSDIIVKFLNDNVINDCANVPSIQ